MNKVALNGFMPKIDAFYHHENREKFLNYEDVHQKWLMFIVEDGAFYYEVGQVKGSASFGDIFICPPGEKFRRVVIKPVTLFVVFIDWIDDRQEVVNSADLQNVLAGKISVRDTVRLRSNFKHMIQASRPNSRLTLSNLHHYLNDIWLLCCEELEGESAFADNVSTPPTDPVIAKAKNMIQNRGLEAISLQEIAAAVHISHSQLSKKFKKQFTITPIQYLTSIRLEKAKSLLLETDLTLDVISECCGYQNGFYLSRVFRKHYKMTPIQFRNQFRL